MKSRSTILIVLAVGTTVLWAAVLQSSRPKEPSPPRAIDALGSGAVSQQNAPVEPEGHVDAKRPLVVAAPAVVGMPIKPMLNPAREPLAQPSSTQATVADDDDGRSEEDEEMRAADNRPEQREWRAAWVNEVPDDEWTNEVRDEVAAKTKSLVEGDVMLSELSCRETVCRMHLQFSDQLDAQAFIAAPADPALDYAYQSLDPGFDGQGFDASDYSYEVLIKRERPAHLPPRSGSPQVAAEAVVAAAVPSTADGPQASTLRPGEVVMKGAQTLRAEAVE